MVSSLGMSLSFLNREISSIEEGDPNGNFLLKEIPWIKGRIEKRMIPRHLIWCCVGQSFWYHLDSHCMSTESRTQVPLGTLAYLIHFTEKQKLSEPHGWWVGWLRQSQRWFKQEFKISPCHSRRRKFTVIKTENQYNHWQYFWMKTGTQTWLRGVRIKI